MTHSDGRTANGKRQRLIQSATTLIHRRGVDHPTLAAIATAASVPPGNVYYYFKTRDDLVDAVVAARLDGIRRVLADLERLPTAVDRLHALADVWLDSSDDITRYGCPIGTLCAELTKRGEPDRSGAVLVSTTIDWTAEQFRQLGQPEPKALAVTMLAIVQGAALIASTLAEADVLSGEIRGLKSWIGRLAQAGQTLANPHDHDVSHDRSEQ